MSRPTALFVSPSAKRGCVNLPYDRPPTRFRANANRYNQVSHAGGYFAAAGDAQGSLAVMRRSTTDTSATELFLDGTIARFSIANNSAVSFSILVVGKTSAGESGGYEFRGIIERSGGSTSIIGAVTKTVLGEDDATWDANVVADNGNGALRSPLGCDPQNFRGDILRSTNVYHVSKRRDL